VLEQRVVVERRLRGRGKRLEGRGVHVPKRSQLGGVGRALKGALEVGWGSEAGGPRERLDLDRDRCLHPGKALGGGVGRSDEVPPVRSRGTAAVLDDSNGVFRP
jgi:hypothetical protein